MQRWRKIMLWMAAGVVALLAAISFGAGLLFDTDNLTRIAQQRTQETLQRSLDVDGLQLRLFPLPELHAERIALSNPPWAAQPDLLQATQVQARIKLLPLLSGKIAISTLTAGSLQVNLETDAEGRKSWQFPPRRSASFGNSQPTGLEVGRLVVAWRTADGNGERQWRADNLQARSDPGWKNLTLSADLMRNAQPLKLRGRIADLSMAGQPQATSDGELTLHGEQASLRISGTLPLNAGLDGHSVDVLLQAASLQELQRFSGWPERLPVVPLELAAHVRRQGARNQVSDLKLTLGRQQVSGSGVLTVSDDRTDIQASLSGERLDWPQLRHDLGIPDAPQRPANELLPVQPLPWPLLASLQAADDRFESRIESRIESRFDTLVIREGLAVRQWRSQIEVGPKGIAFKDAQFLLHGGKARGALSLNPERKHVALELEVRGAMLEDWFKSYLKRAGVVAGGPLNLSASLSASGNSWKELAANMTGPVGIGIGEMRVQSKAAQEAETLLVGLLPALAEQDSESVKLNCVNAWLPFSRGLASSQKAAGLRSEASKLLLGGTVDFRKQTVDLGGRVRASNGVALGIAAIAGDVRIAGPLHKPEVSISPPGALARLGAAIATSGLSIIATAVYDAATSDTDPCATVASAHSVAIGAAARPGSGTIAATAARRAGSEKLPASRRAAPRSADTR